jgi:hypothetical protein
LRRGTCAGLAGAAVAALLYSLPAAAAPIDPSALVPALDLYVDDVIAGHAASSCAGAKSAAANEGDWHKATAVFIATLWANGFPINFVRTAQQRFDAAQPAKQPNCKDPALLSDLGYASQVGWVQALQTPLADMQLTVVTQPVAAPTWSTIKTMIDADAKAQKRLFACLAVTYTMELPGEIVAWDQMISGLSVRLVEAGLPRDEVASELSAVDGASLWHRAPPDTEAGLRDSCMKDRSWQNRQETLGTGALAANVEKLLPPLPVASDDAGT